MAAKNEPIGVIGVGWVGLVTAACFAELGHPVFARDIVAEKVDALRRGETTIHEPGLDELLARNAERLTFTTDLQEVLDAARLLFVCVDTPPTTPATPTSPASAPWSRSWAARATTSWS